MTHLFPQVTDFIFSLMHFLQQRINVSTLLASLRQVRAPQVPATPLCIYRSPNQECLLSHSRQRSDYHRNWRSHLCLSHTEKTLALLANMMLTAVSGESSASDEAIVQMVSTSTSAFKLWVTERGSEAALVSEDKKVRCELAGERMRITQSLWEV